MSVSDGENADASNFNSSFMSREVNTDTVGQVGLLNTDAASGTSLTNIQRQLNSTASFLGAAVNQAHNVLPTWASNVIGSSTDTVFARLEAVQAQVETNITDIASNTSDIADVRTTTGTSDGDTDMGTYTGTLFNDNESTKQNLQQAETAIEGNTSDIADIRTTMGTSDGDTNMGVYTGAILTDGQTNKFNIQELSDAVEPLLAALVLQGNWNANTNTPTLVSSTGTEGHFYVVTVAGSTNLDGETDWNVGDWAVFGGGVWFKQDNSSITHTGEVTGSTILSLDPTAITNKTEVVPASGDFFLYSDTSDSGLLKKADFDDIGGDFWSDEVDADIVPDGAGTRNIGSLTRWFMIVYTLVTRCVDGTGAVTGDLHANQSSPTGVLGFGIFASNNLRNVIMATSNTANASNPSGSAYIETGNQTDGTGQDSGSVNVKTGNSTAADSGDITLEIGTAGGTRGTINLQDGSEGTIGHVWTSTGVNGEGNWAAGSSGEAVDSDQNVLAVQVFS